MGAREPSAALLRESSTIFRPQAPLINGAPLTVMSYILGREVHNRLSGNFGSSVGKIAISVAAVSVAQQVFFSSILGQTTNLMEALGFIAFPTIILTVVFSTICVPLFSLSKLKYIFGKRTQFSRRKTRS